jgi:Na+/melibiose symporter-like transporter
MSLFTAERMRAGAWIALGLALLVLMYLLAPVLTPFALAAILAYLLVPGVDWLARHRVPRAAAVLILFLFSAAILIASSLLFAFRIRESLPPERRRGHEAGVGDDLPPRAAWRPMRGRMATSIDLRSIVATLHDNRFLRHSLACLLFFTVMGQQMATFSVYAVEWAGLTKLQLGWIYSLNGAMVTLLQYPVVRFLAPYRMTTALVAGSVLLAGGYVMIGFVGGPALLALAMAVVTIGEITATPAAMNLSASFAGEETRGRYMGVHGLFSSFGWSLGPLIGGVLLDNAHGVAWIPWTVIGAT